MNGKKILGINPPVWDFAWFDLWSLPVGLLRVLGALRDADNEVFLIDCIHEGTEEKFTFGRRRVRREEREKPDAYRGIPRRFYRFGMSERDFEKRLASLPKPDAILVTSIMTYWYIGVREVIEAARKIFPGVPVLLGGIYATLCPEHASMLGADDVISGPLAHCDRPLPIDLYDEPPFGALQTSYGCPMRCDYCASSILNPRYETRGLDEIFRDLEWQVASGDIGGIGDIAFYDDALLMSRGKIFYPLCEHIRKNFPRLRLHAPNGLHVAHLDERCCQELYESGFRTIRLSLEGVDDYTVSASSGKTGAPNYAEAVRNLLVAGYAHEAIETYILAGIPGQKMADVEKSIEYVKSLGCRPKLTEFSPIPGTKIFEQAAKATPEITHEPLLHNNTIYAQYVSHNIAPEELQRLKNLTRER